MQRTNVLTELKSSMVSKSKVPFTFKVKFWTLAHSKPKEKRLEIHSGFL